MQTLGVFNIFWDQIVFSVRSPSVQLFSFSFSYPIRLLEIRFKFDDERVTKEDLKRALEEQYGGEEEVVIYFFHYVSDICL